MTLPKKYKNFKNIINIVLRKSFKEEKCFHITPVKEKHLNFMLLLKLMLCRNSVKNLLNRNMYLE